MSAPESILESISIDCAIFGFDGKGLKILLTKRKTEPSQGMWALAGSYILSDENLDDAAHRILEVMTGAKDIFMEQIHTFGTVNKYPLKRVITVAYYVLIKPDKLKLLSLRNNYTINKYKK